MKYDESLSRARPGMHGHYHGTYTNFIACRECGKLGKYIQITKCFDYVLSRRHISWNYTIILWRRRRWRCHVTSRAMSKSNCPTLGVGPPIKVPSYLEEERRNNLTKWIGLKQKSKVGRYSLIFYFLFSFILFGTMLNFCVMMKLIYSLRLMRSHVLVMFDDNCSCRIFF